MVHVHQRSGTDRSQVNWHKHTRVPCAHTNTRKQTRNSPDKGINKIKSNQRWESFILNLAIYPDISVIFPPVEVRSAAPVRACPLGDLY